MSSELLPLVLRYRIDALALLLWAVATSVFAHALLGRPRPWQDSIGWDLAPVLVVVVVGCTFAECARPLMVKLGLPGLPGLMFVRGTLLGAAAVVVSVTTFSALRVSTLRAKLRVHATTERQLQQAKTSADDANRAKSDFLAVMSHEIRTPLNAVMGFASLLAESRLDDAQRDYVATIKSEAGRLGSLINDILDLTKIEEGRLALERLPFAPVETVNEVLRLLSGRAQEKRLDLRFEGQLAEPLLVAGDPLRFRQVLLNLVDNAIKFTPRGSVTLFLTWTPPVAPAPHGKLCIRVKDTGIGIPPEKLKDLFTMFMQADTSTTRRYGGTGLGLAICQRLVTVMGGEITVTSTAGLCSEFSYTVPLTPIALPAAKAPASLEPDPAPVRTDAPKILVVDDLETNRFLLEVFLRRNGFAPELAEGGEEAVQLTEKNRYDAILMDLQMPVVDGYTATKRIRASEGLRRRTPIIALTASIATGTREKCLAAGMDEHLTKPLDLKRFKHLLEEFVPERNEIPVESAPEVPA